MESVSRKRAAIVAVAGLALIVAAIVLTSKDAPSAASSAVAATGETILAPDAPVRRVAPAFTPPPVPEPTPEDEMLAEQGPPPTLSVENEDPFLVESAEINKQGKAKDVPVPLKPGPVNAPRPGTPAAELAGAAPAPPAPGTERIGPHVTEDHVFGVTYPLPGAFEDHIDEYRKKVTDAGWTVVQDIGIPVMHTIRAERPGMEMTVLLSGDVFGNVGVDNVAITITRKGA